MTEEQESHLAAIAMQFQTALDIKYRKGQAEHGGNLWDRDVLNDAKEEVIDFVTYVYTADYKRRQAISLLVQALVYLDGKEYEKVGKTLKEIQEQLTKRTT